jgi:cytochrome c oxidase subunit 2
MNRIALLIAAACIGYLHQQSVIRATAQETRNNEEVISITASTFEFTPSEITVKKGVPVTLELTSQDRHHGFKLAAFQVRVDVKPGVLERVQFVPDKVGNFTFLCDVFCGDGHEEMSGTLKVIE